MAKFCKDIPKAARIASKHNPAKLSLPGLLSLTLILWSIFPFAFWLFVQKFLRKTHWVPVRSCTCETGTVLVKTLKGNVYVNRAFLFLNELFSGYIVTWRNYFWPVHCMEHDRPLMKTLTYLPHLAQLCSQTRRIPENHAITWIPTIHFSVPSRRPSWKVERSVASSRREIIRNHVFLQ